MMHWDRVNRPWLQISLIHSNRRRLQNVFISMRNINTFLWIQEIHWKLFVLGFFQWGRLTQISSLDSHKSVQNNIVFSLLLLLLFWISFKVLQNLLNEQIMSRNVNSGNLVVCWEYKGGKVIKNNMKNIVKLSVSGKMYLTKWQGRNCNRTWCYFWWYLKLTSDSAYLCCECVPLWK